MSSSLGCTLRVAVPGWPPRLYIPLLPHARSTCTCTCTTPSQRTIRGFDDGRWAPERIPFIYLSTIIPVSVSADMRTTIMVRISLSCINRINHRSPDYRRFPSAQQQASQHDSHEITAVSRSSMCFSALGSLLQVTSQIFVDHQAQTDHDAGHLSFELVEEAERWFAERWGSPKRSTTWCGHEEPDNGCTSRGRGRGQGRSGSYSC